MRIVPLAQQYPYVKSYLPVPETYDLEINNAVLKEQDNQQEPFEIYPLTLTITFCQVVCIYEADELLRKNLLYGLTRNLSSLGGQKDRDSNVFIGRGVGKVPLHRLPSKDIQNIIGVIMH